MNLPIDDKELAARQRRDFDDFQSEIAGRETGRRARFLPNAAHSEDAKRKEREARAFRSHLAALLTDPIYRAKHDAAMSALTKAETATDTALQHIEDALAEAQTRLETIQDKAARLPDGSRVYKDANNNVRRDDGSIVDPVLVDTIIWSGNEPSFENYRAAQDSIVALEQSKRDILGYQNDVLGPARDRVTDEDNPPSLEELDGIIQDIKTAMPEIVQEHVPKAGDAAPDIAASSIMLPKLGG